MAIAETPWVRPCDSPTTAPRWGHRNGLQVGLPVRGPHGLLNLYMEPVVLTRHVLNFIAIEPVVNGARGLSELEPSKLDARKGKRLWSANEPVLEPQDPSHFACGVVERHGTTETLKVYIVCERFDNGAHVYLRLTFRSDAPGELQLETFAAADSAPISHCVLTATMGNYTRLRSLHLKDRLTTSGELWPDYKAFDFAPAKTFQLDQLRRTRDGGVFVAATPDEDDPASTPAPGHWNYTGIPAMQYWSLTAAETSPETLARVNGRYVYWLSEKPIPGGISFENLEIERPFRNGEAATYGVTTETLSF